MSTFLIWIFESKLIVSNNQSSATLWVLDTCLIVGLLSFLLILITASPSSKDVQLRTRLEKNVCLWERGPHATIAQHLGFPFVWVWCVLRTVSCLASVSRCRMSWCFGILWVVPSTSMTKSHKSSAGKPSIRKPASNDMISDSVELWDTDVCLLHIQLMVTNVRLPKMHKIASEVDFESS